MRQSNLNEGKRARIARQTQDFLEKGGKIEKIEGFVEFYQPKKDHFIIGLEREEVDPLRKRFIKLFDKGKDNKEVSDIMKVSLPQVRKWRKFYQNEILSKRFQNKFNTGA